MSKPSTPPPVPLKSGADATPSADASDASSAKISAAAKRANERHAATTLRQLTDHCPSIVRAWVSPASADGQHSVLVQRNVRDVEGNATRTFVTSFTFQADRGWVGRSMFPLEIAKAVRMAPSPSGKYLAVVRSRSGKAGGKDKFFLDVSDAGLVRATVELTSHHGKVLGDGWFGCLEWSADETKILYTAAPKEKKTSSFWATDKGAKNHGTEYDFKEDWGEVYTGVSESRLFVCDWQRGKVAAVPGITSSLTAGQAVFAPNDAGVCFTGWDTEPRRLGMIYCFQRPCALYLAPLPEFKDESEEGEEDSSSKAGGDEDENEDVGEPAVRLTDASLDSCARSPVFSPCGRYLAYISSFGMTTHNGAHRLCVLDWSAEGKDRRVVCDVVETPGLDAFPGLFVHRLSPRCWARDSSAVYCNTMWRSQIRGVRIQVSDGAVTPLEFVDPRTGKPSADKPGKGPCAFYVGNCEAGELMIISAPDLPDTFQLAGYPELDPPPHHEPTAELLRGMTWEVVDVEPTYTDTTDNAVFQATVLLPKPREDGQLPPLIAMIHGGPHSSNATYFHATLYAYLVSLGFAIVSPNYRGSIGFGAAALNSLPGRAGTQDVEDVTAAIHAVLNRPEPVVDASRVGVCGGSHGGFLSLHMVGQHPELIKVAAVRNPVANMAHMVGITDIPDWCWVEGLARYDFSRFASPTPDVLATMYDASPIAHIDKVKAPVMIALGAKDRRCPPSGGMEYYHVLRSRGVSTRMLVYPEDMHAISKPASEADCWVNFGLWLSTHLGHNLLDGSAAADADGGATAAVAAGAGGDAGAGAQ